MSIKQILDVMDKLNMMHRSLLKLAYHKTEMLKTSNVDGIDETMKNEQSHVAAIAQLEQLRQKLVRDFFNERQIPTEDGTIAEILMQLDGEQYDQLKDKRNELLLTIETLRQQNDLNQKLLFQSLQFVNLTLDLLRPQPDQINYGATAGTRKTTKKGQFDSMA